ncbi:2-hydroxychromene-2-carboxylate isomerase [Hydrogenophaga sp. PBL-H3]|uniref:2-hydroxychromene-2-carboxylate isomerase n=1 Tax=Hydrogenophaga sp. PBL-H3 TaxID=434010 RepID=UPI00131F5014|nr:2-hydroxychromene-2-carboxylate isomerase [Hydrogenophaga sp. PBL-H3]QHE77886.1 2-hydroxychromene-2-carboxylate isomerase [Hydrogenophaga sp. PBL-H3]QHE82310.1 2-hydroxychromene-2-carboxylate isomerase [Hydrogenophaga sp. PBL-H3]
MTNTELREITFHYDPISPYAHLAFECLPLALMGHSVAVRYKPVLFAALLKAHGQLGPAEIPAKRDWTYRQVAWLGHHHGVRLELPAAHPFNPLPLLRLGLACATDDAPGDTSRYVTEQLFHHVWHGGQDAADPARLAELQARLQDHMVQRGKPWSPPDGEVVKQRLRANTDEAMALGLFGVPSVVVDGRVFWGFDALPMLRAHLEGDAWFDGGWDAAAQRPEGVRRR